jgi:hypothetical protein
VQILMQHPFQHVRTPMSIARGALVLASMELWRSLDAGDDSILIAAISRFDQAATNYARAKCIVAATDSEAR